MKTLNRPYKDKQPKETIYEIKNILEKLNIITTAVLWFKPYKNIYSVRIEAIKEDGSFGSNGKGKTETFAIASAYAEFMERWQNLFFTGNSGFNETTLNFLHKKFGYYYYPDEKQIELDEFLSLPVSIKKDLFPHIKKEFNKEIKEIYTFLKNKNKKGIVALPFYNIKSDKLVNIPYNLLNIVTGSNGMAAGNSLAEATYQAICELYERYAASLIYFDRLTPPTIPNEFLEQFDEEYQMIKEIEKDNRTVIVKDFSCNMSLPVVGLIIIDNKTNKYRLNIGTDTCFKIALSRTLTEIFQGIHRDKVEDHLLEFPDKENTPYFFNDNNNVEEINNFRKYVTSGDGVFPPSLFEDIISYKFNPEIFNSRNSYEEETKHLIQLAKNNNIDVYLRDNSFLGFPTVYVYMPKVSKWGKKDIVEYDDFEVNNPDIITNRIENNILPFLDFVGDKKKIKETIELLSEFGFLQDETSFIKAKNIFRLDFLEESIWNNMSLNFFLVILYYLIGDYSNAIKYLSFHINNENISENLYYKQVMEFLTLKDNKKSIPNTLLEIANDFKNINSIFSHIGYPNCPFCETCKLKNECKTKINIDNFIRFNTVAEKKIINQYKFFQFK